MLTLPSELTSLIVAFAPLFSKPIWQHVQVLLVGTILAPGKRTVTATLRVCGPGARGKSMSAGASAISEESGLDAARR